MKLCPQCDARYSDDVAFCGADGLTLHDVTPSDPLRDLVVDDGYRLGSVLGRGGFGTVYRASHSKKPGVFAVKVLRADRARDPEQVGRFRREIRAAAALRHPHVVEILAFGHDDRAGYYVVMPLLVGLTLHDRLRSGRLPLDQVDAILRQTTLALAIAHENGVVHRDVKTENVFLERLAPDPLPSKRGPEGEASLLLPPMHIHVRLLDFGLAKLLKGYNPAISESWDVKTRPRQVLGSPLTMSPEQVLSQDVDGRSDLYSLGVVLFEMLTGTLPFDDEKPGYVMRKHVFEPPPLAAQRPGCAWVPPALDALVQQVLAKRPSHRPQSTAELLAAWAAAWPEAWTAWQGRTPS